LASKSLELLKDIKEKLTDEEKEKKVGFIPLATGGLLTSLGGILWRMDIEDLGRIVTGIGLGFSTGYIGHKIFHFSKESPVFLHHDFIGYMILGISTLAYLSDLIPRNIYEIVGSLGAGIALEHVIFEGHSLKPEYHV